MRTFLCQACGTSFPQADAPPGGCRICLDGRQYVPATGQAWTDRGQLAASHRNAWQAVEPNLFSIQTVPAFAIDQRAFLLRTPGGNILWDCIALIDEATEALVRGLGGIGAIAISHPHYYTTMQDWAAAFDAPIHLHEADSEWICRPSAAIRLWRGDSFELAPGTTLVRGGGHFSGGTVLHHADEGGGLILSGDILQVTPGGHGVSFMWSYPNMLPLGAEEIRGIERRLAPWPFERIYGAFAGKDIRSGGKEIVRRSVARYLDRLR